jgi:uncharacterized phage protein (TIGR01671 family)
MRELKFRAYNRSAEVWVENLSEQEIGYLEIPSIYTKITQFTGLLDKKGVEIYEGDIVKGCTHGEYVTTGSVEFFDGSYILRDERDKGYYRLTETLFKNFEVIGDIYETPELLKER